MILSNWTIVKENEDNSVVFNNHNDEYYGNMYRLYKHNYYKKNSNIMYQIIYLRRNHGKGTALNNLE